MGWVRPGGVACGVRPFHVCPLSVFDTDTTKFPSACPHRCHRPQVPTSPHWSVNQPCEGETVNQAGHSQLLSPTGVVRTALSDLDREAKDTHLLVIQAKDMIGQMGGLSGSTSVTVIVTDVNDNPPRFPRSEFPWWGVRGRIIRVT